MFLLSPKSCISLLFDPVPHIIDKAQHQESTTRDVSSGGAGAPRLPPLRFETALRSLTLLHGKVSAPTTRVRAQSS